MHHHEGQTVEVDHFYSTWMVPDNPAQSCCNQLDCYSPARVEQRQGHWYFERREDGKMIPVPPNRVEQNRDNPDGRNHVCASVNTVYCFIAGSGI